MLRNLPRVALIVGVLCSTVFVEAQTTRPATRPSTRPTTAPIGAKSLSADQMLSQMLRPGTASSTGASAPGALVGTPVPHALASPNDPPAIDVKSGAGAVMPAAPAVTVVREGTFLVDRIGRLTRSADGTRAEFTFETDGRALRDPPLIILPNLKLMSMEAGVTGANRDLRFRVSGTVTEYRGRNYILLEKVLVEPDIRQQF